MDSEAKRAPAVVGRMARVEFCPCGSSLLLSIGPLTVRLDYLAAEDVAATLGQALAISAGPTLAEAERELERDLSDVTKELPLDSQRDDGSCPEKKRSN